MKKYTVTIFTLLILIGCNAQKKNSTKLKTKIMEPIVTSKFEVFDSVRYENLKKKSSDISELLADGTFIEMSKAKAGLQYVETPHNSYFNLIKIYYQNGNIKSKGLGFNAGFAKGIWYEFNEQGKLEKTIDYDKDFKFTWEDVIRFCEKEKIPLVKGYLSQTSGYHTSIKRNFSPILGVSTWIITWLKYPDKASSNEEILTLDGNTGKIVKRSWGSYFNN